MRSTYSQVLASPRPKNSHQDTPGSSGPTQAYSKSPSPTQAYSRSPSPTQAYGQSQSHTIENVHSQIPFQSSLILSEDNWPSLVSPASKTRQGVPQCQSPLQWPSQSQTQDYEPQIGFQSPLFLSEENWPILAPPTSKNTQGPPEWPTF